MILLISNWQIIIYSYLYFIITHIIMIEIKPDPIHEDLNILLGLNSLPISLIERKQEEYNRRFRLRWEVMNYFSDTERREISTFSSLSSDWCETILLSDTLADFIWNVHRLYEQVLQWQETFEKRDRVPKKDQNNMITGWVEQRKLSWDAPNPIAHAVLVRTIGALSSSILTWHRKK